MAQRISISSLLISIITASSLFTQTRSKSGSINWWCDRTPHPRPCKLFMASRYHHQPPRHQADFRNLILQVAMERAKLAHEHVLAFGPSCETKHQRSAWRDCQGLYEDTVLQLSRTLQGVNCTAFDAQTWLSSALTNIHTCQAGSMELNVSSFISPLNQYNVSELISNGLAVNAALLGSDDAYFTDVESKDFPDWVTGSERRLLASVSLASKANIVVAKDGSSRYTTIQSAINVAARRTSTTSRFIIYVKRGIYRENVDVANNVNNVVLVGDGMKHTIITSSRSVKGGHTTYNSATAGINGLRFMARDITFRNTAGPSEGQAVALRSGSDLSVFYRCAIQGYQDSLMVHSQRQFYRECYIYGTIDFIFGNAAAVFQNSMIYVRKPLWGQVNVITAQGRNDPNQNTGIAIHNSRIMAANDLKPVVAHYKTYLGRPWQAYSRVVVMKSYLDTLLDPTGWLAWEKTSFALSTLYYAEYNNIGPRSATDLRVKWTGFKIITSPSIASRFTVESFIAGRAWLPATGVPYSSGL
uniref:Pectinesterase n=1 Tax=Kalanchoe fedtschenkoi TaxID=63787 RepID=A0A7N1A686_KALFE